MARTDDALTVLAWACEVSFVQDYPGLSGCSISGLGRECQLMGRRTVSKLGRRDLSNTKLSFANVALK